MTADFTRRDVVSLAACAALQVLLGQVLEVKAASGGRISCFIGQSGLPKDGKLCLGSLITSRPVIHQEAIADLRKRMKHRRVLRPHATDKYAALFCRNFVEYMLNGTDIRFVGAIVEVPSWPDSPIERDRLISGYHATALDEVRLGHSDGPLEIHLLREERRLSLRTKELAKALLTYRGPQTVVKLQYRKDDDLIQLAGFLASSIRSEGGQVKRNFRDYLKAKLNAKGLGESDLRAHPQFRIRQLIV